MSKFKVGDNVRILDVDAIWLGRKYWENGDVVSVLGLNEYNLPILARNAHDDTGLVVDRSELHAIERIGDYKKSSKKQRIATLENEVAELKERLEALEDHFGKMF